MGAPGRPQGREHDQGHYQDVGGGREPGEAERRHAKQANGKDGVCGKDQQSSGKPLPGRPGHRDEREYPARPEDRPVHGSRRSMGATVPADRDDRGERDGNCDRRLHAGEAAGPARGTSHTAATSIPSHTTTGTAG